MVDSRPYIHVKSSLALKEAVQKAAYEAKLTDSEWIRKVLADACGYDLGAEKAARVLGRPRTYTTDAERLRAKEGRRQERDKHARNVRDALMKAEGLDTIEELEAWLQAKTVGA